MRSPFSSSSNSSDAPGRIGGLKLGCQSWSFNNKTALESIALTAKAGGRFIEFFPGQKVGGAFDGGVGPGMDDAALAGLLAECARLSVTPVAFGVAGFGASPAEHRKTFEFAKKLGLYAITCEPSPESLDSLEALVKEFDIRIAIHNHPRQPRNPNYRFWDPGYVIELVGKRDPRLGSCADVGHWVRSGLDPVKCLRQLGSRVHGCHLKELSKRAPDASDVPSGTGNALALGVLDELHRLKIDGAVSIEYETDYGANAPEIGQCIGFVRAWAQLRKLS